MKHHWAFILLVGAAALAIEQPVEAYLDPGSGSMLLQILLGGFAATTVAVRLVWRRVRGRLAAPFRSSRHHAHTMDESDTRQL